MRWHTVMTVAVAARMAAAILGEVQETGTVPVSPVAEFAFFTYLQSTPPAALVALTPTHYDPRDTKRELPSLASVQADLEVLAHAFDGLILYGYDPEVTPGLVAEAVQQSYRAILLGLWDPTSEVELAGTVALIRQYHHSLAIAVCIGNEGIAFNRYTLNDLEIAAMRLTRLLEPDIHVPLCTSEPFSQYGQVALQTFGSFLAPNIHPVFDQPHMDPAAAAAWVRERAMALAETVGKPLVVKETGFPHGGASRFTPTTQKAFWVAYVAGDRLVKVSTQSNVWVSYAAGFEAFDTPFKAEETQMPMEGAWGLLNADRQPFPAFFIWKQLRQRGRHLGQ